MNRIISLTNRAVWGQFIRFLLSGGAAALANFGSRFLFGAFLPYLPSIVLAFFVGLITAFFLMRAFVFLDAAKVSTKQLGYFVVVNLVGLVITVVVSLAVFKALSPFIHDLKSAEAIGHLFGVCAPVLVSFYAHKYITFR